MSKRYAKYRSLNLPTVERVEIEETVSKKRVLALVIALLIAFVSFYFAITNLFKTDGWTMIEANSSDINCSELFALNYYCDSSAVRRGVSLKYSELTQNSYKLFDENNEYEDFINVFYINHHPNEVIEIDEKLYKAFKEVEDSGNKYIYQGPMFRYYDNIFFTEFEFTENFDPLRNEEVKIYFEEISAFIENDISIELLGNNKVRLNVSDDYLKYAKENGIDSFIDFYYLKTAFLIDYIADGLKESGYVNGSISSYNGLVRTPCDQVEFGVNIYANIDNKINQASAMSYTGPLSLVTFRNYQFAENENYDYLEVDGVYRHKYLNNSGIPQSALNELYVYDSKMSCAEIMLKNINNYMYGFEKKDLVGNYIFFNKYQMISNKHDIELINNFTY